MESAFANSRAVESVPAPGGKGTMSRMGRSGYSAAAGVDCKKIDKTQKADETTHLRWMSLNILISILKLEGPMS